LINLPRVKLGKGEFTTATRKRLDVSYTTKRISSITDLGIQRILIKYLETFDKSEVQIRKGSIHEVIEARIGLIKDKKLIEHPELAFSPEGIEDMNKNIAKYNNAKFHQPIFNVRIYEKGKGRFVLGEKCNKKTKYVQGSPNLFFAIYENKQTKDRMFDIVPLKEVIEHQKKQVSDNIDKLKRTKIQFKNILELNNKPVEVEYLFHLSPNDLVYIPTKEEIESINKLDFENLTHEQKKRLYNVKRFFFHVLFQPKFIRKSYCPERSRFKFNYMKRSQFIQSLGLGTGGLILPVNSFIQQQPTKIYDNYVKGLTHYQFKRIERTIKEGDELLLKREPTNLHDTFAIEVYFQQYKIGYITAFENVVMSNMMDHGVALNAYASKVDLKTDVYRAVAIEIFAPLVMPSQKLIQMVSLETRADDAADFYRNGY
jgi:hypothetical protein